jgi:hypothetical protein
MNNWVRLPTRWIGADGLNEWAWRSEGAGSNSVAALMCLIAIAHVAEQEEGFARVTYDSLYEATGLSRKKISAGLTILGRYGLIDRKVEGRSRLQLTNFDPKGGWAKLPAKSMYSGGRIIAFDGFKLRSKAELDALKLYLLFVAFRDRKINAANLSHKSIEKHSGVDGARIKTGIGLLVSQQLVHVDQVKRDDEEYGVRHTYRVVGIDSNNHMGTSGRHQL